MTLNAAEHDQPVNKLCHDNTAFTLAMSDCQLVTTDKTRQRHWFAVVSVHEVRHECLKTALITAEHCRLPRREKQFA